MTGRGMFVVVEALDGVGKTTLVRRLADRLNGVALATPGELLRPLTSQILDALGDDELARCLFYASTVLAQGRRARAIADAGGVAVMDRYWWSTIAYARARGVTADLSSVERYVPVPEFTVLLLLDERERVARIRRRGGATTADKETFERRFRERVLAEMRRRRPRGGDAVEVNVTGADPEEAVRRVLDALGLAERGSVPSPR